jgi:hypothetical protein
MAGVASVGEQVARLRAADEGERHAAVQQLRELCLPKTERCVEHRLAVGEQGGIELMVHMLDSVNGDVQVQPPRPRARAP